MKEVLQAQAVRERSEGVVLLEHTCQFLRIFLNIKYIFHF